MGLAIRLLGTLKTVALFAVRRPKDAAVILLALILVLMFWRLKRERSHVHELATKLEGLPPDTKQVVTIYRDRIRIVTKESPTEIVYQDRYLPPEGHVEVVTKVDQLEKPPEVMVKDRGFTKRLGVGLVYSGRLLPELDIKIIFYKRYSLVVATTYEFAGPGVSRHVGDFTPFENLEILGLVGLSWQSKPRFGIGLRTNF